MRRARSTAAERPAAKPAPSAGAPPAPPRPPASSPAGRPPPRDAAPLPPPLRLVNAYHDDRRLVLVERAADGSVASRAIRAEHACFVRADEIDERVMRAMRGSRQVAALRPEGDHLRIVWSDKWARRRACERDGDFARIGIDPLEADVDPVRRWLTDNPGGYEIVRPRRCYLDIEADSRQTATGDVAKARMLAWAVVDDAGALVASGLLPEDTDQAERALLVALWAALDRFDQVVSWAGDFFDFPYLLARTSRRRIPVEPRRWLWLDHLVVFRKMNMNASESGDEKQSLALDAVAKSVCGVGKLEGVSGAESWTEWTTNPARLLAYCEHDTRLMQMIEAKSGYLDVIQALCESTFCFADTAGVAPTRQLEGFLMRLGAARGLRFPTHHYDPNLRRIRYEGAYVMEPTRRGIVRGVHVCDFARLYPSIYLSFNLSPETMRGKADAPPERPRRPSYLAHLPPDAPAPGCTPDGVPIPEGCAVVPATRAIVAQAVRGVLAEALEEMLRLRKHWDKLKAQHAPGTPEWKEADRRSAAYKIGANSFYGVTGSPFSRFFDRLVAESCTLAGVWLIKETIEAARARGLEVIYGDTDSAFVVGCTDEQFAEFVAWCNAELYPRLLRERGAARNAVSLEYEKKFLRAVFVSKKRYAARFEKAKGKVATAESKLEVKGLEYKRGDTALLARQMQLEAIEMLLRREVEDPAAYAALLDGYRDRVLDAERALPLAEAVISKRLTKHLGAYVRKKKADGNDAAQSPHVEVARQLEARGRNVRKGERIAYVVVDGGSSPARAIPAEDYAGDADRFYLWEQLVYPPTRRVLEAAFPDQDWARWERVRPPRPRKARSQANANQLAFVFV